MMVVIQTYLVEPVSAIAGLGLLHSSKSTGGLKARKRKKIGSPGMLENLCQSSSFQNVVRYLIETIVTIIQI